MTIGAGRYNRGAEKLKVMIGNHLDRYFVEYGAAKTAALLEKLLQEYREMAEGEGVS
jgi:hypothetical protein